jgi:SAM-dependent methyltransferase
MSGNKDIGVYWQSVYSKAYLHGIPSIPSQFAVFIAGEMVEPTLIVDIGCGNGRDTMFLGQLGHRVIGFDAAESAIALCKERARDSHTAVSFECADISSPNVLSALQPVLAIQPSTKLMVYSRFFLHAVPQEEQAALLLLTRELGSRFPIRLAVEFRTLQDAVLPKTAAQHYRRFIDPLELMNEAKGMGFKIDYFVEGTGYAKHGADDAYVARCIFSI